MAHVCVTGANGFLGAWLVRRLERDGHRVRILARAKSDLSALDGANPEIVHGDILEPASLDKAFAGQEAVFHLAGLIAYKPQDRPKMELVNVTGTRNVVAAVRRAGVKRLVHVSSVVAVGAGFSPREILNEESTYNVGHLNLGYFETKRRAEVLVREAVQSGLIDAVIVNPSTIYGPGDARKGSRGAQLKVARGKLPVYPPGGVNVVGVESCVDGIVRAWQKGRSGERYILCGENILIRDLFRLIAEAAGVPAPRIPLPAFALHALGAVGDLMAKFGKPGSLSSETAWTSTLYHWFDSSKARRELGFDPGNARDAVGKSVKWAKENIP